MKLLRKDDTLGEYHLNELCITLSPDTFLFGEKGFLINKYTKEKQNELLSTFLHEYYHYIHNFSTISGFRTFFLFQDLLSLFSNVVSPSGIVKSNILKNSNFKKNYNEITAEWKFTQGDYKLSPSINKNGVLDIKILNIKETIENRTYFSTHISRENIALELEITDSEKTKYNYSINLGESIIDEGICYEIDRLIALKIDFDKKIITKLNNAPLFPYLLLNKIGEYLVPSGIESYPLIACAKLALLTTNPGKCLVQTLKDFNKLKSMIKNDDDILNHLWKQIKDHFNQVVNVILTNDLPNLNERHKNRGLLEIAIQYISDLYSDLLSRRQKNPFFDITPYRYNACNFLDLSDLINSIIPCAVLQKQNGDFNTLMRDSLYTFTPKEISVYAGYRINELIRPLQSQLHYLRLHLGNTFFVESSVDSNNYCPFYTCCDLPFRKESNTVCKYEPWKNYRSNDETCWYGTAVASVIGLVNVYEIKRRN